MGPDRKEVQFVLCEHRTSPKTTEIVACRLCWDITMKSCCLPVEIISHEPYTTSTGYWPTTWRPLSNCSPNGPQLWHYHYHIIVSHTCRPLSLIVLTSQIQFPHTPINPQGAYNQALLRHTYVVDWPPRRGSRRNLLFSYYADWAMVVIILLCKLNSY